MSNILEDPRASDILDIVAREANIPRHNLLPEATISALGIASIDMIHAIFEIETKFDVEIPVAASGGRDAEFITVGDLLSHVLRTIDGKPDAPSAGTKQP